MPHKAYIAERDTLRQEIERQVNEYLSRGGIIRVCSPGESAIQEEFLPGKRNRQGQKAYEYEIRAREARFELEGYA